MEIFENFSTGSLESGFGTTYDGWTTYRGTSLSVISFGGERVLAGKVSDTGSKRLARPLINNGGFGRIEAKWKVGSAVAADYAAANNFYNIGFMIDATDVTGVSGSNKRAIILSYEGAGSNVGIKFWNGTSTSLLLTITSVPTAEWLTVSLTTDGTGRYTAVVAQADGTILGSGSYQLSNDAAKRLYAYVDFGYTQNTSQNTWGTQVVMKDIIARDDFIRYDEVSQRRHLRFSPYPNSDTCYVVIPKDWNPAVDNTKVIISGHGYNATIGFATMLSAPFPDAGYVYGISNTHGNTWGNAQSSIDMEAMRQWIVDKCGGSEQVFTNGSSMGNLCALNYIAKYPDKVRRHVGEIGVCSLRNLYNNGTFTASIDTAYSVTRFDDIPLEYDPIRNVSKYVDMPMMLWVGTSDTTVPHGLNVRPFYEKLAKLGGKIMYIEEPGETHSLDVDPDRYLDFYNADIMGSKTRTVVLDPSSVYRIETKYANTASYLIDANQGTLTSITTTEKIINTKTGKYTTILLKTTGDMQDVSITKIG